MATMIQAPSPSAVRASGLVIRWVSRQYLQSPGPGSRSTSSVGDTVLAGISPGPWRGVFPVPVSHPALGLERETGLGNGSRRASPARRYPPWRARSTRPPRHSVRRAATTVVAPGCRTVLGGVEAALDLAQKPEDRGDFPDGVLIHAVQPHQRVEHQEAGAHALHGVKQPLAVGAMIQPQRGYVDDGDVERLNGGIGAMLRSIVREFPRTPEESLDNWPDAPEHRALVQVPSIRCIRWRCCGEHARSATVF